MKTLECRFMRWHYDNFAAPANVPASKAEGIIKYAAPDKGLFRAEQLVFYAGADPQSKNPIFKPQPNQFGEYWVCNGTELIEFDRSKQECTIQQLPENMRGKNIVNGPLPFVFNLDAKQIQQKYWVRQVASPNPGIIVVEAWPKVQETKSPIQACANRVGRSDLSTSRIVDVRPQLSSQKRTEVGSLRIPRNQTQCGHCRIPTEVPR